MKLLLWLLLALPLALGQLLEPAVSGQPLTLAELLHYLEVYGWKFTFMPQPHTQQMTAQLVRVGPDGSTTPISSQFSIHSWRPIAQLEITLLLDYRALRARAPVVGMLRLDHHAFPLRLAADDLGSFVVYGDGDGGAPRIVDGQMILLARFAEGEMLEYVRLELHEYLRWDAAEPARAGCCHR